MGGILDPSKAKLRELMVPTEAAEIVRFDSGLVIANLDLTRLLMHEEQGAGGALLELEPEGSRPRILAATRIQASFQARFASDGTTLVDPRGTLFDPRPHRNAGWLFHPITDVPALVAIPMVDGDRLFLRTLADDSALASRALAQRLPGGAIACASVNRIAWLEAPDLVRIIPMNWIPED